MNTYIDFRVVGGYSGYDIHIDINDLTNIPCGWIMADQLGMFLQSYQDIEDNDIYIRFKDMYSFMHVPNNRGEDE